MENLQVQRKKMSLANIEGRLTLEEMENVMAGSACHDRVYGWASGVFVASLFGGPMSAIVGGTIASVVMLGAVACGGRY